MCVRVCACDCVRERETEKETQRIVCVFSLALDCVLQHDKGLIKHLFHSCSLNSHQSMVNPAPSTGHSCICSFHEC